MSVTFRALAIGAIAFLVVRLLATTQLYATTFVLALLIILIGVDLARVVIRTDRSAERFLEALTSGVVEVPIRGFAGLARLVVPFERAATMLGAARAEQQQQQEYLQTLLDTVSAILIVVRSDGSVTLVNRAARKFVAAPIRSLEDIVEFGTPAVHALRTIAPGARQIIQAADGRQMLVAAAQFSIPGREPERLISLQRIAGELDAVELKAWQDMARVIAHEMMNSLTPIASLSESLECLLRDATTGGGIDTGNSSDDIAGALEVIKRRSLGLMNFIERYRSIAELPWPRMQSIHVGRFLGGIEKLMSASFRDRCISCQSRVVPPDLFFFADPELLEQAMINLLRNAADAVADVTHPEIGIACELKDGQIVLSVSDNGIGLPDHQRDQIFVPFFTTRPGGSGIGLSLARRIALAHGGKLEAHANSPAGAVFSMTLPMTRAS